MKMSKIKFLITALVVVFAFSCKDDEKDFPLVLPSNLAISVEADTVTEGLVRVTANADKANFYTIFFNENGVSTTIESKDGMAEYQYTTLGTYTISVRAHALEYDYIEGSKSISVSIDAPGNDGNPPTTGFTSPLTYPGMTLVWNDEFSDSLLNENDWNFEIGNGDNGWGNNELQYYKRENVSLSNGILTIEAKDEFTNGFSYSSSRITTQNKQSFKYGRIDIRAAMPFGKGLWPALWMLGENITTVSWPACGEIDIMEMVGGPTTSDRGDGALFGTAHWLDGNNQYASFGRATTLPSKTLADEFHVYSIIWDDKSIKWLFDNVQYNELATTDPGLSEFNQNYFFILNVAVGGNLPGLPDNTTIFPQKMFVDYVRVFQ